MTSIRKDREELFSWIRHIDVYLSQDIQAAHDVYEEFLVATDLLEDLIRAKHITSAEYNEWLDDLNVIGGKLCAFPDISIDDMYQMFNSGVVHELEISAGIARNPIISVIYDANVRIEFIRMLEVFCFRKLIEAIRGEFDPGDREYIFYNKASPKMFELMPDLDDDPRTTLWNIIQRVNGPYDDPISRDPLTVAALHRVVERVFYPDGSKTFVHPLSSLLDEP